MANNNVQAQETESLNIREAFFLKYKKAASAAGLIIWSSSEEKASRLF